jgi:hypothetical protein
MMSHQSRVAKHDRSPSIAGRWYLAFIGLSLALMGTLFVAGMWRSFVRAVAMQSWPKVECQILTSELEERRIDPNSPPEFRLNISYGYLWEGKPHTGDHLTLRGTPWTSKSDVVQESVEAYPEGTKTSCFVDPANPDFSVLKPDSKAPGYSIWFPALFVVGGLGITFRALTVGRRKSTEA